MNIVVSTPIVESPRVTQVRGMFDLTADKTSTLSWNVDLPLQERPWNLGLLVGPSGCGKSTIARRLFPETPRHSWPDDRSLLDAFPVEMSIREVVELLSSVGFSSPPAWMRPYRVLSTGQQFRVDLARLLADAKPEQPTVIDEFTSTVDRTVAQIGSAALARTVRRRKLQIVAVTCHDDVENWFQPDWVYRPAEQLFTWRCLQRRPQVRLAVVRCKASAWALFAPHHYLNHALMPNATCFLATWQDRPVAFSAWASFYGKGPKTRREHRTVTLPDYQGIGIGNALSAAIASLWKGLGWRAISTTTHPAMIQARMRSRLWFMHRRPSFGNRHDVMRHASTRLTAGFEYVGPAMPTPIARLLLTL